MLTKSNGFSHRRCNKRYARCYSNCCHTHATIIPDGSSHWSWLTAWFCLGPIILVVCIDHFVAPSRRQEPIKWLDCEKLSPEISELKSDMIEVGYTLTSDEGFNLPHSVELSDTSLITKFPRTLYPHEIGIFSRSTMLLSFHGLTPLGKNLKLALKRIGYDPRGKKESFRTS